MIKLCRICFVFLFLTNLFSTNNTESLYLDSYEYTEDDLSSENMSRELKHHKFFREERDMGPLWAMDVDSNFRDGLKLRKANKVEAYEFEYYMGPVIKKYRGFPAKASRTQGEKFYINSEAAMTEIMKIVNNFVLTAYDSSMDENGPNFYQSASKHIKSPTITIYFKGPYSALNIKFGSNEWRFFISPPSPLPGWFYDDRMEDLQLQPTVTVPKAVEKEFYYVFLRLLNKLLKLDNN